MEIAEVLKTLADENRLRILAFLGDQTLCVCDLEGALGLEQSNLSRHLSRLKQAGLVKASKKSQFVYYSRSRLPEPYGPVVEDLYRAIEADPVWAKNHSPQPGESCCSTPAGETC